MAAKKTKQAKEPEPNVDDEEYEIESIIDSMMGGVPGKPKTLSYFVSWRGYPDSDNCYVTFEDAANAGGICRKFWYYNTKLFLQLKIPLRQLLHLVEEEDDEERFPSISARTEEHKKRAYALIEDIKAIQKKKDEDDAKANNLVIDAKQNGAQDQEDDKDEYENAAESLEEKNAANGEDEEDEEEENQLDDDKHKSPSPKSAPPSSKPTSNGKAGAKRGRGRPSKSDKESAKKQKQNDGSWDDDNIAILGVSRPDGDEVAKFKVQFADGVEQVHAFTFLVDKAPKTLCRYLAMYMDFDRSGV